LDFKVQIQADWTSCASLPLEASMSQPSVQSLSQYDPVGSRLGLLMPSNKPNTNKYERSKHK
jgi:hypothetical protein